MFRSVSSRSIVALVSAGATLAASACGIPQLRQRPGSDLATRSRGRIVARASGNNGHGCAATLGTISADDHCLSLTTDTLPGRRGDRTPPGQPPRPLP